MRDGPAGHATSDQAAICVMVLRRDMQPCCSRSGSSRSTGNHDDLVNVFSLLRQSLTDKNTSREPRGSTRGSAPASDPDTPVSVGGHMSHDHCLVLWAGEAQAPLSSSLESAAPAATVPGCSADSPAGFLSEASCSQS